MRDAISSGPWPSGIDSLIDPQFVSDDKVQWAVNMINRGGHYQTRPGYNLVKDTSAGYLPPPRGLALFTPKNGQTHLVKAVGSIIRISAAPFTTWSTLAGITMDNDDGPVHFEVAIKGAITHEDGTFEVIDPYPVLMIQCGNTKAAYWDGVVARHLDPTKTAALSETPIGTWMKWIGSRLWVAQGSHLRVSDVLDPLKFTEEDILAEGGFLSLPDNCTGLGSTADLQSLLAFTETNTTAFEVNILDRNLWGVTPGFQRVILPDIGCAAGFTIVNQYGLTWWLSHGGLIGLDGALQSYRTSKITYKDNNMARSKGNLSKDISRACAGAYENFLVLSVPSGDTYNAHTWVMDQGVLDELNGQDPPAWASCWTGTRPVQWVQGPINGQNRCFFISRDYPPATATQSFWSGVWEAFCGIKFDYGSDVGGTKTFKAINWSLETKQLSKDASYKTFDHFKVRVKGLSATTHIDGYYASAHAGYKQVLSKDIIATTDSLNTTLVAGDISTLLPVYISQVRTLRSDEDQAQTLDNDAGVEEAYTRNKDTAFSVLLKGTGQIVFLWVALYFNSKGEQPDGKVEADETTVRTVTPAGANVITANAPLVRTKSSGLTSNPIVSVVSRATEDAYSSMS